MPRTKYALNLDNQVYVQALWSEFEIREGLNKKKGLTEDKLGRVMLRILLSNTESFGQNISLQTFWDCIEPYLRFKYQVMTCATADEGGW